MRPDGRMPASPTHGYESRLVSQAERLRKRIGNAIVAYNQSRNDGVHSARPVFAVWSRCDCHARIIPDPEGRKKTASDEFARFRPPMAVREPDKNPSGPEGIIAAAKPAIGPQHGQAFSIAPSDTNNSTSNHMQPIAARRRRQFRSFRSSPPQYEQTVVPRLIRFSQCSQNSGRWSAIHLSYPNGRSELSGAGFGLGSLGDRKSFSGPVGGAVESGGE